MDASAPLDIEHDAREVVEQAVIFEERARVLRDRNREAAERRPRFPCSEWRVGGGDHVGSRRVHLEWIAKRRCSPSIRLDDRAGVIDTDQIRHANVLEVHPEGIDPEAIRVLGIQRR